MKRTNIVYWILNGLFALAMGATALPDALSMPDAVTFFGQLGLPAYLLPFLGIAKILGAITIIQPRFPRLKEWAYAGLTFDLLGAIWCVSHSGAPFSKWWPMLLFVTLAGAAYASYHARSQRLAAASATLA